MILDKDMAVEHGRRTIFARETGRDGETAFVGSQSRQADSLART
jgi:hypothetical protein